MEKGKLLDPDTLPNVTSKTTPLVDCHNKMQGRAQLMSTSCASNLDYLEDVVEHDDGLAAARPGVIVVGPTVLPADLPEPLDLRGAEADDLARQRRRPRRRTGVRC